MITTLARIRGATPGFRVPRASEGKLTKRTINLPDLLEPFIRNRYPLDGAVSIPVDGYISYTVLDDRSGVDLSNLNTTLDGYGFVQSGVIQDGYSGTIAINRRGFDVFVEPDADLDGYATYTVATDIFDIAGNQLIESWSFTTV